MSKDLNHWRSCAFLSVQDAATILGISRSGVYRLAGEGSLRLHRVQGRTVVSVPSLIGFIDDAAVWVPSNRVAPACAAKSEAARARRV